jgi:5-methylthioadenosine/S-adenosylhomocysteine deaminase
MPAVLADLCIEARWIVPMTMPGGILENHTLVVRDGRILDLLPSVSAAERYAATVVVRRPGHLLMPGMINAATRAAMSLFRAIGAATTPATMVGRIASLEQHWVNPEFVRDGVLAAIAEMLRSGITCFADRYYFPDETARIAGEQGIRAVIGMPVAEKPSLWAKSSADYLTRALGLRDEYKGHPLISTAFAPHAPDQLSDATFTRVATLADELDAGILIDLHESAHEIAHSIDVHGGRPIQRLWNLGLLTPALNAVHMAFATAEDIELAHRTGISISVCPQSSLGGQGRLPPITAFTASGIRLSVGSGGGSPHQNQDVWGEMKSLALAMSSEPLQSGPDQRAWQALAIATRGGAAALGLDGDLGTLEPGKWADLCCVDLAGPATQPLGDPVKQLVFCGGRDIVSDVWVAGRQLVSDRELTRLNWAAVSARANSWALRPNLGG